MHNHDWIISVLSDIQAYSEMNGLKETEKSANFLRIIAEKEIFAIRLATPENRNRKPQPPLQIIQGSQPISD